MQRFILKKSKVNGAQIPGILLTLVFLIAASTAVHAQSKAGQPEFTLKPTTYNAAILATRAYFILNAKAGATLSESIRVGNVGKVTGKVIVYPVTATTDETSGVAYLSKGDQLRDVAAWIGMQQQQLTLAPGQSQVLLFKIAVPAKVHPGQHLGGIVAENLITQSSTTSGAIHINVQQLTIMAVQVNVTGSIVKHMAVTDIEAGGSNGYQSLLVHMTNNGDTMLKPTGEMDVSDMQGHLLQKIPLKLNIIVPNTSIDYPAYVQKKALAAGVYRVAIVLDYGKGKVLHYAKKLTITEAQIDQQFQPIGSLPSVGSNFINSMPLWQIIVVALAAGIVLFVSRQKLYKLIIAPRHHKPTNVDENGGAKQAQEELQTQG